ncbi:MAG: serine/threonine-protein kinase, partial [Bryobacterales bacterium]|nr:serine/threonine-protein kinase [Bryobacterales bacterium]
DYGGQIADALAAAHRAGLIHRDLKPGNIMITPEGRVKVVDFGLAKLATGSDSSEDQAATRKALTAKGAIIGTVAYMSPEQAEGKPLDARSDIFSYGAVVYEMLTARRAFVGDSGASTMAAVLREDPLPLDIPKNLDLLVAACLKKDPNKRLQSIADARLLLGISTPSSSPAKPASRPLLALAAVAVAAALLTSAITYLLWGRKPQLPEPRPIRLSRLTSGLQASFPALSPDGNLVAYARVTGQQAISTAYSTRAADLYLQPVRGGAEVRLTNAGTVILHPVFSADGTRVYYTSLGPPRGAYEVSVTGGESRLLVRDAFRIAPSPDGKWLAYIVGGRLLLRPTDGGPEKQLSGQVGGAVVWSPDSTELMTSVALAKETWDIARIPVHGGESRPTGLGPNLRARKLVATSITELKAWLSNGDIVFCAPMGVAANLHYLPLHRLKDGAPIPLTNGVGNNCSAAMAKDRLVFANQQLTSTIFRLPVSLDAGRVNGDLQRVTPEGVESQFPDVRPDGSAMAFISRTGTGQFAYLMDLARAAIRPLLNTEPNLAYTTFSPDGSKVAVGQGGSEWPALVVPTVGGDPVSAGGAYGRIRGWSPDGRYLLTWRQNARTSIGVLDLTTKTAAETHRSDTLQPVAPRLSPDGRWVVFSASPTAADVPDLYVAPFRGAQPVPESEWKLLAKSAFTPVWSPDRRWLHFLRTSAGVTRLLRVAIDEQNRFKSEPVEFYSLEGRNPAGLLLNSMTASREHLYMVLLDGPSDIWSMDLPR